RGVAAARLWPRARADAAVGRRLRPRRERQPAHGPRRARAAVGHRGALGRAGRGPRGPGGMSGALYRAIFPRRVPDPAHRPQTRAADGAALRIRWLGTAGFVVEAAGTTIAIDPFVTRPSLGRLLGAIAPDDAAIAARLPARLDAVLC